MPFPRGDQPVRPSAGVVSGHRPSDRLFLLTSVVTGERGFAFTGGAESSTDA